MNRKTLLAFAASVAIGALGVGVGKVLAGDGSADAAPRDAVVTVRGNTAKADVVRVQTPVALADGGFTVVIQVQASAQREMALADAGTLIDTVDLGTTSCTLVGAPAAAAAALVTGSAALCARQAAQLER